jgi:signal transduction histidine kinase
MTLELFRSDDLPRELREKLGHDAEHDITELDALIGDLLLAARLEDTDLPRNFTHVMLDAVVAEEAERAGASARTIPCAIDGDARMLTSLVRNLLENARRYGRPPIGVSLTKEGDELCLRVEDRGDGVAADDRERIFEPFFRPQGHREGKHGGVGLGLSLVKRIAEHHGGSVRYAPREGGGSTFEVRFGPRAASRSPARSPPDDHSGFARRYTRGARGRRRVG